MNSDLKKAAALLKTQNYTCVFCSGDTVYTSLDRGVKPLLEFFENGPNIAGFSAADKVVGNAAAYLYALLEVSCIYAPVMSEAAADTLRRYGITPYFDTLSPAIRNRDNTGFCPMESAVSGINGKEQALTAIKEKLKSLKSI